MPRVTLVRLMPLALIALAAVFWKQGQIAWHVQSLRFTEGKERERHLDAIEKLGEAAMPQFSSALATRAGIDQELGTRAFDIFFKHKWSAYMPDRLRVRLLVHWPFWSATHIHRPRESLTNDDEQRDYHRGLWIRFGNVCHSPSVDFSAMHRAWSTAPVGEIRRSLRETLYASDLKWQWPTPRYDEWPPGEWYPVQILGAAIEDILTECLRSRDCAPGARAFAALHLSHPSVKTEFRLLRGLSEDPEEDMGLRVSAAVAAVVAGDAQSVRSLRTLMMSLPEYHVFFQPIHVYAGLRALARRRQLSDWSGWVQLRAKHSPFAIRRVSCSSRCIRTRVWAPGLAPPRDPLPARSSRRDRRTASADWRLCRPTT